MSHTINGGIGGIQRLIDARRVVFAMNPRAWAGLSIALWFCSPWRSRPALYVTGVGRRGRRWAMCGSSDSHLRTVSDGRTHSAKLAGHSYESEYRGVRRGGKRWARGRNSTICMALWVQHTMPKSRQQSGCEPEAVSAALPPFTTLQLGLSGGNQESAMPARATACHSAGGS